MICLTLYNNKMLTRVGHHTIYVVYI